VNRAEAAKAGESISHLPHGVGLRVEHDRLHPGTAVCWQPGRRNCSDAAQ
jgi:hypothetical protein